MPEQDGRITFQDFSAGWIPSDHEYNGRKNGLLRMSGVALDEKGALTLAQGTLDGYTFPAKAHTIFSKFVGGNLRFYAALVDGSVWRIQVGDVLKVIVPAGQGSTTRAAFGTYGDYVLVFSGPAKFKDTIAGMIGADNNGVVNTIGLATPDMAPILNALNPATFLTGTQVTGTVANLDHFGTSSSGGIANNGNGNWTTPNDDVIGSNNCDINANVPDFPKDLSGSPSDIFSFRILSSYASRISSVIVRFYTDPRAAVYRSLVPGSYPGNILSYYAVQFTNSISAPDGNGDLPMPDVQSQIALNFSCQRSDFNHVINPDGSGLDWSVITGFDITVVYPNTVTTTTSYSNFQFATVDDAVNNITGTYDYVQQFVANGLAFSDVSPVATVTVVNGTVEVIPEDPTLLDGAVDVWIYRRGGTLEQFYRVGVIPYGQLGPLYDNMSDQDAQTIGITVNQNLVSTGDITDDVLEIVGPINDRMIYFTATQIIFSQVGVPDNLDPQQTINISGIQAEVFLWAKKLGENVVLVATSYDLYILTGTMVTFPDGTLDVFFRPLGMDKIPFCRDAAVYQNNIIYFSYGWQMIALGNTHRNLGFPSTELLYQGKLRFEYGGVPTEKFPEFRYSCTISRDKLYCVVPYIVNYSNPGDSTQWKKRLEIYDFNLNYWRPLEYTYDLLMITEEGAVYAFRNDLLRLDRIDDPFSKLLNTNPGP